MVVVGGGILTEDTIWASSKGKSGFVKDGKNLLPVFRVIKDILKVVVKYYKITKIVRAL